MRVAAVVIACVVMCAVPGRAQQGWEWQNPLPHGQSVNDIVMLDDIRGVAVCENGYYMHTADGGKTWSTWRLGRMNLEKVIALHDGSLITIADQQRIYRSTDFAYSWDLVYEGGTSNSGLPSDMVLADENTLVGFLNGAHVVISEDGGKTWRQFTNFNVFGQTLYSISAQSSTTWYIVTSTNLYKTTDRGKSWFNNNGSFDVRGLTRFVYVDSLYGYQLREGQLLRTHDGGLGWEEMDIFGFDTVTDLEAGPKLGSTVFCMSAGRYIINKSSDAGGSWNISLTGSAFPDANPKTIAFANSQLGFVAGDGGRILRTEDGGLSWAIVHGIGYISTISDLVFSTPDFGMAATFSSTLLITTNGGRRWDEVLPSSEHTLRNVAVAPDGTWYLTGLTSANVYDLLRSTNNGLTWEVLSRMPLDYESNRPEQPLSLYARANGELWVGATYSLLLHSTDGGVTWDRQVVGNTTRNPYSTGEDIFFFDPSIIIYVRGSSIEYSTDNGQTWDSRYTNNGRSLREVQFVTPDVGYALTPSDFGRTSDGGVTWDVTWGFMPQLLHYFDEWNGVMLWTNADQDDLGYLLRSSDGGQTYEKLSLNENVNWSDWYWHSRDLAWAYGYGGLIRRNDSGGLVSADPLAALPSLLQLQPGYPNPWSRTRHSTVTVPFTLSSSAPVQLTLYDMLGRPATVMDQGLLSPGFHQVTIDRSRLVTLAPGLYLYRLSAGDASRTGRLVVK
ncbi:T9SS type A sorting domain-containing protein [bacterium]|nr:T9SS type A sorting domain-containing protein [bacterium]